MSTITKRLGYSCDADICRRVSDDLARCHFPAFRQLGVIVHDGVLTLSGCVSTYYEKQVALTTGQQVDGVTAVIDRIDVDREWDAPRRLPK